MTGSRVQGSGSSGGKVPGLARIMSLQSLVGQVGHEVVPAVAVTQDDDADLVLRHPALVGRVAVTPAAVEEERGAVIRSAVDAEAIPRFLSG